MIVTTSDLCKVYDGWITECSVLILQSCTTYLYGIAEGLFDVSACYIKYQILVSKFLDCCCSII